MDKEFQHANKLILLLHIPLLTVFNLNELYMYTILCNQHLNGRSALYLSNTTLSTMVIIYQYLTKTLNVNDSKSYSK